MTAIRRAILAVLVLASSVTPLAQPPASLTGEWVLVVAGQREIPVAIVQQNTALTLRVMPQGQPPEIYQGTLRGTHLEVARQVEPEITGDAECRAPLAEAAQALRADPQFRNFIRLDAASDGTYGGQFIFQRLVCENRNVTRDQPQSLPIVLRPAFPPFTLRFVTMKDNAFVAATEARLGGDVYVEAVFKGQPKETTFEVSLKWEGGSQTVAVTRTADPLIYRSAPLRLKTRSSPR